MDNVVLAEILKAHEDRTARLHAMVLDARDAILTAIKSQDDPPVWMREAFDKLHAVHHGMGGDPFQMHMRAAVDQAMREATIAGWNACRKSIYAVCEDVSDEADRLQITSKPGTASEEQHAEGYYNGQRYAAKSIARGFNSMEARDDDYLAAAIRRLAEGGENHGDLRFATPAGRAALTKARGK